MKMTKGERFVAQTTSGRWLLTVMAGIAFLAFSIAVCLVIYNIRTSIKTETIVSMFGMLMLVVQGVYKDYFNRQDRNDINPDEPPADPPKPVPPA
jgi:high-affinity Fe2+/Pb2+ permease